MPDRGLILIWGAQLPYVQGFLLVLAGICAATLVRAGILAWAVLSWPLRTRLSSEAGAHGRVDADRVAIAALAGAIRGPRPDWDVVVSPLADARFDYRWRMAHARVVATKGLSRITVLLSVLVVCFGAGPAFFLAHWESNRGTYGDWVGGLTVLSMQLAVGLAVAILLSVVAVFFEGRLIRRKASWRLFRATVVDAGSPRE